MPPGRQDIHWLDYDRLVPSVLLPPEDPTGSQRRTARDWIIDLGVMLLAAALGALTVVVDLDTNQQSATRAIVITEIVAGAIAVGALWFRRSRPVAVGLLTSLLVTVSVAAGFAATFALFTVAVHRRFTLIVPVFLVQLVAANVYWQIRPTQQSWLVSNAFTFALCAIVVGYGMFVRARRQLVWTLQERTRKAESEQDLFVAQARTAERTRIAREMHDVLGHRISLIALHAGGLEVRPDLPPQEVAATAQLLRSTARSALDDLREIIGVLREDGTLMELSAPQPTLADIPRMVEESRRAGQAISLSVEVEDPAAAPAAVGRVAYRVVQESLTNVAKHAQGSSTRVDIAGGPDRGLIVRVRNQLPTRGPAGAALPSGGAGLIGLRERVELAGGRLAYGPDGAGAFEVEATLRWA